MKTCYMMMMMVVVAMVTMVATTTDASAGKTPPLLPTEYAANVFQHKWNENEELVNHYYNLMLYVSVSRGVMRSDGQFYGNQNSSDPNLAKTPGVQSSYIDFTQSPHINTYYEWKADAAPAACIRSPLQGGYILPNATYLADNAAIFAGEETVDILGTSVMTDKWDVYLYQTTVVTFYIAQDGGALIRWDLVSPVLKTSVVTLFLHNQVGPLDDSIFVGNVPCPPGSPSLPRPPTTPHRHLPSPLPHPLS